MTKNLNRVIIKRSKLNPHKSTELTGMLKLTLQLSCYFRNELTQSVFSRHETLYMYFVHLQFG